MWHSLYFTGIAIGYIGQVVFWLYEKVRTKKLLFKMAQDKTLGKSKMTPQEIRKWLSHHNRYSELWRDHGYFVQSSWVNPLSDYVFWIGLTIGVVVWPMTVGAAAISGIIILLLKASQKSQEHLANQVNAVLDDTSEISEASISRVRLTGNEESEKGLSLVQN